MEPWLVLTIVSIFGAGINSFIYKVAAKEKMDIYILTFYMTVLSTLGTLVLLLLFSDFSGHTWTIFLLAIGVSSFYYMTNIVKVNALQSIDSTLFFPIYKVLGPMLVIIFGITIFQERFTSYEWIGLILSLLVPIMLITRSEQTHQSDLKRGLLYLVLAVIVGSASHIFWKHGADIAENTWLFIFYIELTTFLVAACTLPFKFRNVQIKKELLVIRERKFLIATITSGVMNIVAGAAIVFAFVYGGALGIVNTIGSLYILIPIILSIVIYKEHWNLRKLIAIILSIVALVFFL